MWSSPSQWWFWWYVRRMTPSLAGATHLSRAQTLCFARVQPGSRQFTCIHHRPRGGKNNQVSTTEARNQNKSTTRAFPAAMTSR